MVYNAYLTEREPPIGAMLITFGHVCNAIYDCSQGTFASDKQFLGVLSPVCLKKVMCEEEEPCNGYLL